MYWIGSSTSGSVLSGHLDLSPTKYKTNEKLKKNCQFEGIGEPQGRKNFQSQGVGRRLSGNPTYGTISFLEAIVSAEIVN